jgi:hypothetical protein
MAFVAEAAVMMRSPIRVEASAFAPNEIASAGVSSPDPCSIGPAITTETITAIPSSLEVDWEMPAQHKSFAALERKVGRRHATQKERDEYAELLRSRRAWVRSKTYLDDYLEIERQKLLLKKLAEVQALLKPIKIG